MTLTDAKARLSEVVRRVRRSGEPVVLTVDGEAAVQIAPVDAPAPRLTAAQVAADRALEQAIRLWPSRAEPFDAVELVRDGRR